MSWWDSFFGNEELSQFEIASQQLPTRAIRVRDDRLDQPLPFEVSHVPWFNSGRWLVDGSIRPAGFLEFAANDYYIQDAGSLLPIALLAPQPGELICDLCAAPGGKASAILELMQGNGLLVANEAIRSRVDSLRTMLARTGHVNAIVANHDPDQLAQWLAGRFDAVLVDAPCSGQMLVGKDKRDENAWSANQVLHSAKRQNRILDAAIRLLKPGGRLVYSTCTFAPEEDEHQLQRIVEQYPDSWRFEPEASLAEWESPLQEGCYRLWPHRHRCAGGFAGRIVKISDEDDSFLELTRGEKRRDRSPKRAHPKDEKAAVSALDEFGILSERLEPKLWNGQVHIGVQDAWPLLSRYPALGEVPTAMYTKGSRWLPSQPLAWARARYFTPHRTVALGDSSAKAYLAGDVLGVDDVLVGDGLDGDATGASSEHATTQDSGGVPRGWGVAQWRGSSLGWIKGAGNRWNNHLPAWAAMKID